MGGMRKLPQTIYGTFLNPGQQAKWRNFCLEVAPLGWHIWHMRRRLYVIKSSGKISMVQGVL